MGFGQLYEQHGVKEYYLSNSDGYSNPHASDIQFLLKDTPSILNPNWSYLDLACGDGIVSKALIDSSCYNIEGCDPFLSGLYEKNTGKKCHPISFEQISFGILSDLNKKYDAVICSYALHLAPTSFIPNILFQLREVSDKLIILTPHKRPVIGDLFWNIKLNKKLNKTTIKVYDKIRY
jgi:2-polyprenyl-3-methyl-5-hydroxy-6-metoxy-1,4-benzoquinol methylase